MGFWPVKCERFSPVNEILVVDDWLKNWSWLTRRVASVLDSLCFNTAKSTHTQLDSLEPTDRCRHTSEKPTSTASLWDSEAGMRVMTTLRSSLEVSGKMKVERENWSMERKRTKTKVNKTTTPCWVTPSVLTFRLQILHNILLALVKRELAWEVEAFFALYFDWLLVDGWVRGKRGRGGQWEGTNKNRMAFKWR